VISAETERCVNPPGSYESLMGITKHIASQQLKCSGDMDGCQRCENTNTKCTYRSSARSSDHSKRRQSSTESETPVRPRPKRQRRKAKPDTRPTPGAQEEGPGSPTDTMAEPLSSADLTDGFWTPVSLSDPTFVDFVHDWDDNQSPSMDMTLADTSSLSLLSPSHSSPQPHSGLTNNIFLTAPPGGDLLDTDLTDYPRGGGGGCDCLRALADILERIHVSGDGNSNGSNDMCDQGGTQHFDDLLGHLRDGIETCMQVLPCNYCSVRTANSTLVVTVVHQLAVMSQDLCRQLLAHQQTIGRAPAAALVEDCHPHTLLLSSEVYVGKYHVRSGALYVEFILAIVGAHLEDLRGLIEDLRGDVKKRSRAAKLLGDAADVATRTASELQRNVERREQ